MSLTYSQAKILTIGSDVPDFMGFAVPIRPGQLNEIILRDYQLDLLLKAAELMRQGYRRILIQLPTGGGKTVLAAQALMSAHLSGFTGQFIVHRKELITQTSKSFTQMGLEHGFIAAGRPINVSADVILAGVQSLATRLGIVLPANLLIIDEAHHAVAASWDAVMAANPDAFILGLTATPERLDGRGLSEHFDIILLGPTVAELMARGFLSPYDYYAPNRPDVAALPGGADYSKAAAEALMDRPELIGDMVEHYLRLAKGEPGLMFATSREHSRNIVDAFIGEGVRAAHIDGSMTEKEREWIDDAFRARDIDVLSSVDIIGEGYDVPAVRYVGQGKPTKSLSRFLQWCGRGFRPIYAQDMPLANDNQRVAAIAAGPKPRAIISDHASNIFTHMWPDDPRNWTLAGGAGKRPKLTDDEPDPVRQCLACYRVYPSSQRTCPGCGEDYQPSVREIRIRDGRLEKLERESLKVAAAAQRKAEERACVSFADHEALARSRGYSNPTGWASMRMEMKTNYARFR